MKIILDFTKNMFKKSLSKLLAIRKYKSVLCRCLRWGGGGIYDTTLPLYFFKDRLDQFSWLSEKSKN